MNPDKRRLLINAGLLAGVLTLASVLWLAPPQQSPHHKPFAAIDTDTISKIEIITPQQPVALLQRQDGEWHAIAPLAAIANHQRVQNLLNIVNVSVADAYNAADIHAPDFGLEPPAAILRLDEHSIYFGASDPQQSRRYVLYNGKLYLFADMYYPLLSRGISNLLNEQWSPAAAE